MGQWPLIQSVHSINSRLWCQQVTPRISGRYSLFLRADCFLTMLGSPGSRSGFYTPYGVLRTHSSPGVDLARSPLHPSRDPTEGSVSWCKGRVAPQGNLYTSWRFIQDHISDGCWGIRARSVGITTLDLSRPHPVPRSGSGLVTPRRLRGG